jgi:hypothetical protein
MEVIAIADRNDHHGGQTSTLEAVEGGGSASDHSHIAELAARRKGS